MKFEIKNRWSGAVQFTAEIEADENTSWRVKAGLAAKWAFSTGANLMGANLTGADLTGADLRSAALTGADLRGANLTGADLTGADLRSADLRGADLRGADLTGADLRGAALTGADLRSADLRGANLTGAKIKRVVASASRLDGYSFLAFELEAGGVKIKAGCRWFTVAEYRAHISTQYPNTTKASETSDILDFIEARVKHLGITP